MTRYQNYKRKLRWKGSMRKHAGSGLPCPHRGSAHSTALFPGESIFTCLDCGQNYYVDPRSVRAEPIAQPANELDAGYAYD